MSGKTFWQHFKWYVWSYSPLSIVYQFDVKLTSLCFGMCRFVLNRTIVIFYTDLTIWIIHLRCPHMCVYPLATYVCLSTRHICVFVHSPHMGVYPLATYMCLSLATYVCMYQVRIWISNVIWFGSFLCSMILMWDVIVDICRIAYNHCLHFLINQKYLFINVWRKFAFDICFTGFGTALTTILPILFQFCYQFCYSDSRNLWAVMKAGGFAL